MANTPPHIIPKYLPTTPCSKVPWCETRSSHSTHLVDFEYLVLTVTCIPLLAVNHPPKFSDTTPNLKEQMNPQITTRRTTAQTTEQKKGKQTIRPLTSGLLSLGAQEDHMNMRISPSGSKAQSNWDTQYHALEDPRVHVVPR